MIVSWEHHPLQPRYFRPFKRKQARSAAIPGNRRQLTRALVPLLVIRTVRLNYGILVMDTFGDG